MGHYGETEYFLRLLNTAQQTLKTWHNTMGRVQGCTDEAMSWCLRRRMPLSDPSLHTMSLNKLSGVESYEYLFAKYSLQRRIL